MRRFSAGRIYRDLDIRHKLAALAGLIVISFSLTAAIYQYNSILRQEAVKRQQLDESLQQTITQLSSSIQDAHRYQLAFLAHAQLGDQQAFYVEIDHILRRLNSLSDLLGGEEAAQALANLSWHYKMLFDQFRQLQSTLKATQTRRQQAAAAFHSELPAGDVGLQSLFLRLQLADYQASPHNTDETQRLLVQLHQLPASDLLVLVFQEYLQQRAKLHQQQLERQQLIAQLDVAYGRLAPLVGDLSSLKARIYYQSLEVQQAHQKRSDQIYYGLTALLSLLAVVMTLAISRSVVRPILQIEHAVERLRDGGADLTRRLPVTGKHEIGRTAEALNGFLDQLQRIVLDVQQTGASLVAAAQEINVTMQSLASAGAQQSTSLQQTSASLEEMSAITRQNAEGATAAQVLAERTLGRIEHGSETVGHAVEALRSIVSKIAVVDDIAYQTNLLALNASIEAARAGDAGRGFSVVASEVRKLAEHSQHAAKDIDQLGQQSQSVASAASQELNDIVPLMQQSARDICEITLASKEQSDGICQISDALVQIDMAMQVNVEASDELAQTARQIQLNIDDLYQVMEFFVTDNISEVAVSPL
ncbi:Methyl-accepting chemotaxis protein I [BD1-7 clade bacterium]|uniref:Methyl-accepting chemotaxis protein I n=1 Tax=BD1-7 clade bacterium TaxID=2029982 RepID=A0A5S9N198_9GAMM|nr:Methyl-accepting chemotaxis protein I [BD1-7 clade bacterium]CAA0082458.1 Methyl-accepting chemotaxis protein I [BD1-7 clade bacterium]